MPPLCSSQPYFHRRLLNKMIVQDWGVCWDTSGSKVGSNFKFTTFCVMCSKLIQPLCLCVLKRQNAGWNSASYIFAMTFLFLLFKRIIYVTWKMFLSLIWLTVEERGRGKNQGGNEWALLHASIAAAEVTRAPYRRVRGHSVIGSQQTHITSGEQPNLQKQS